MKRFQISIIVNCELDESELWPSGDGPENPTSQDVKDLIDSCGKHAIIEDWDLHRLVKVKVNLVE